jgi:hypothetical protein
MVQSGGIVGGLLLEGAVVSCGLSLAPCGLAIELLDAEGDAVLIVT